jgi:DNA-binding transcriptional ArsR family regulator
MARSKARLFDPLLYQQSLWFKAHAHPARIIILFYLLENGICPFSQICRHIPLSKEAISQHLKFLRKEKLVILEEKYPYSYYSLNIQQCKLMNKKIKSLSVKFDRLLNSSIRSFSEKPAKKATRRAVRN